MPVVRTNPSGSSGKHSTRPHDEPLTGLFINDAIIKPGKKP